MRLAGATINLDNAETAALSADPKPGQTVTYSLGAAHADLLACLPAPSPTGIAFQVKARDTGEIVPVKLKVPGLHNVANALAALGAAQACGVSLAEAAAHLSGFSGTAPRRDALWGARQHLSIRVSSELTTMLNRAFAKMQ